MRLIIAEVALALEHLHGHDIAYRDLKPENVMFDEAGMLHRALTVGTHPVRFGTVFEES